MRLSFSARGRSASVKVAVIAFLTLVLLIPIAMIKNVVVDRQNNAATAAFDIRSSWGGDQVVTGPILKLPYEIKDKTIYGLSYVDEQFVYLLLGELSINAAVQTETRYRGMHKVPVFGSIVKMTGRVDFSALERLGMTPDQIRWAGAELIVGVNDPMALNKIPLVSVNAEDLRFKAGGNAIDGLVAELTAPVGKVLDGSHLERPLRLDISLSLNGSGSLRFFPLAENAQVTMTANWGSPSFVGRQLPSSREIRDDGFDASWHSTRLGRKLPEAWTSPQDPKFFAAEQAFGARFIETVGLYQVIERSTKYAVLVVGLTFVAYFLMEVVAGLRLHPLQYLLVGLANTLFYLLLLSLAEHLGFAVAYCLSAAASTALIAGYSAAVLTSRPRAFLMVAVLAALYGFLYMTLKAENFALLTGSIGLWVALAVVMYLTRRINWYADDVIAQKQADPA